MNMCTLFSVHIYYTIVFNKFFHSYESYLTMTYPFYKNMPWTFLIYQRYNKFLHFTLQYPTKLE